jgi:hypothetical protein
VRNGADSYRAVGGAFGDEEIEKFRDSQNVQTCALQGWR